MTEYMIPTDAHIRKIQIHYWAKEANDVGDRLCGLRFFDKDGKKLLECGYFDSSYKTHTMAVEEDARALGLRAKTAKSGYPGQLFDIEFLLCKVK